MSPDRAARPRRSPRDHRTRPARSVSAALRVVALFLRRLRDERLATLGLAALVLVTTVVFAAAPRSLEGVANDALRTEVLAHPLPDRNLELAEQTRICACGEQPLQRSEDEGQSLESRVPATLRSTLVDRVMAVDSPRFGVVSTTPSPSILTLRWEPRSLEHVQFVAGRPPAGAPTTVVVPATATDPEARSSLYEVALAESSAAALGVGAGSVLDLRPDRSDPLIRTTRQRLAVQVVGIYRPTDGAESFWFDEPALLRPTIRALSPEVQFVDVVALAGAPSYGTFLDETQAAGFPLRYRWRMFVDPDRLEAGSTAALIGDLRRLATLFPPADAAAGGAVVTTQLLSIVTRQDAAWHTALGVLAAIAIGPAAIAVAALALVALLGGDRRRATVATWRARGGSIVQLLGAAGIESVVVVVPAALLGGAIVAVAIPGQSLTPLGIAVVGVALASAVLVLLTVASTVRASGGPGGVAGAGAARSGRAGWGSALGRDVGGDGTGRSPDRRRRLALEAVVVALAIAAVWLLRDRSLRPAGGAGAVGVDPLVAAGPALGGLAAGLVAARLVPPAIGLGARAAASGRGLVGVLGLRRATRGGPGGAVLLVLLATALVGAFSSAVLVQLDRAPDAVSWHDAGAAFRIADPGGMPGGVDPTTVPGVEAVAAAYRGAAAIGGGGLRVAVLAVDPSALSSVVAGTPIADALPVGALSASAGQAGAAAPPGTTPLAALVSTALATDPAGVRVGTTFGMVVDGRQATFRAVAAIDDVPTLDRTQPFVVVSKPAVEADRRVRVTTTDLYVRASDDADAAIRAFAVEEATGSTVFGRARLAAQVRGSPILAAVSLAVDAAVVVAALYAALAVAAALALASAARTGETAVLRTFGLTRRDAVGLVVAEHGPVVGLAFVVGVTLGIGLYAVVRPGLALTGIVGSTVDVPIAVEPSHLALLLAAMIVVAVAGIGAGVAIQRRALLAGAIRRGVE